MQRSTLNQLEKKFNDIADAHGQIKSFQYNELSDITTETNMPLMWVFVADSGASQNGVVLNVPFSISIMDLVHKDEINKTEVSSDCLEIIKDVVAKLRQEDDLFILDDTNINYVYFYEDGDYQVTGWNVVVNLKVANDFNACDVPVGQSIPVNVSAPIASVNGDSPDYLSVTSGAWTGNPDYTYQWYETTIGILINETLADMQWAAYGTGSYYCIVTATNIIGSITKQSNTIIT